MKKTRPLSFTPLMSSLMLAISMTSLTACGNEQYDQCKANASKLWDDKAKGMSRDQNLRYWNAIERCKKKFP